MKTLQEIFDTVLFGLRAQGCQSQDEAGRCVYRDPEGRKCAAGLLIKDWFYHPSFEGLVISQSGVWGALVKSGVPDTIDAQELVLALQCAHDSDLCLGLMSWEVEMVDIASDYGLTYTPPQEVNA